LIKDLVREPVYGRINAKTKVIVAEIKVIKAKVKELLKTKPHHNVHR
jgi:hypothetical protein